MHQPRNRQGHVWLLAGTGEGPALAAALQAQGFQVSVSVVTEAAALPYRSLSLHRVWVGALSDEQAIVDRLRQEGVDQLVDATHPFATQITAQLVMASRQVGCPLIRYERPIQPAPCSRVVESVESIPAEALAGQRLLLALGSRYLGRLVPPLRAAGALLYARVLPTPLALRQAVAAGLPDHHLALLRPLQGDSPGSLEQALCRHWGITAVLCRQSGGAAERCWHEVCIDRGLPLWLLRRPAPPSSLLLVHSVEQMLARLD
ncbi:MAG: precorrin-6x reductase [Synechococcus sp. NAT40]|uniref:precorrin-6A/cobalt-precorrin-6A reductase n=1 Tax=Synechococcus sp. MIT S9451 TaxID=3082543 RepID=UPI000C98952D|nr:precorrin-6x reductase [Synechococcus sp. NAT40]RZO14875.1 MAG: precorrin-6A/cobalt-precorrin-6A reductase [Synechococcus sp. MED-G135]